MRLTDLFLPKQMEVSATGNEQLNIDLGKLANVEKFLQSLTPGQTILGEVMGKQNGELMLKVADQTVIKAALEQELAVDTGTRMSFQVKANSGKVTLQPLFANMATEQNAFKALSQAGYPVNEANVAIVKDMMDYGMSIDRGTLGKVLGDIARFPQANPQDVLDLHKLNLPVTNENLTQIASYKNLSYQMEQGFEVLSNEVESFLKETENPQDIFRMTTVLLASGEEQAEETEEMPEASKTIIADQSVITDEEIPHANSSETKEAVRKEEASLQSSNPAVKEDVQEKVQEPEKQTVPLKQQLFEAVEQKDTAKVAKLVKEPEILQLLKEKLTEFGKLELREAGNKEQISNFYAKAGRLLEHMEQALNDSQAVPKQLQDSVKGLQSNLDFMNQLNELVGFVQLPLKLNGNDAHGDLYVFSNKKHMAEKDGTVTAYLHLDMKYLGSVGVYVALKDSHVNTKFTLENDSMLDFLEAHMDQLTARLEKRGYSMNVSMETKENSREDAGIYPILADNSNSVPISFTSFDVRA